MPVATERLSDIKMRSLELLGLLLLYLTCSYGFNLFSRSRLSLVRISAGSKRQWGHFMSSTEDRGEDKPLGVEETTQKYGLEAGLFKAMTNKDGSEVKPGELLKKYGAAYLITSITLAIISYAVCFFLVSAGVDVASLLKKVGIEVSSGATSAGTAGIAYVIHKAASPIRFPPTVALTPVVANILGKSPEDDANSEAQD